MRALLSMHPWPYSPKSSWTTCLMVQWWKVLIKCFNRIYPLSPLTRAWLPRKRRIIWSFWSLQSLWIRDSAAWGFASFRTFGLFAINCWWQKVRKFELFEVFAHFGSTLWPVITSWSMLLSWPLWSCGSNFCGTCETPWAEDCHLYSASIIFWI